MLLLLRDAQYSANLRHSHHRRCDRTLRAQSKKPLTEKGRLLAGPHLRKSPFDPTLMSRESV
jgi:hypothetical protein